MRNRENILEAALHLFVNIGSQSTTTAKIAEAARVSNGTLFYYFKTKDDLILSLYLWKTELFHKDLSDSILHTQDKQAVKQVWCTCLHWYLANKESFAFFNMYNTLPDFRHLHQKQPMLTFPLLESFFISFEEHKLFEDIPLTLLINSFYGSIIATFKTCEELIDYKQQNIELSFNLWWRSVERRT